MTPLSMIGYLVILGIIVWTIYGSMRMESKMYNLFGAHLSQGATNAFSIIGITAIYITIAYVVFFALPKYLAK